MGYSVKVSIYDCDYYQHPDCDEDYDLDYDDADDESEYDTVSCYRCSDSGCNYCLMCSY